MAQKVSAATTAAAGMVSTQAQTIRLATAQTVSGGGEKLQFAEKLVNGARRGAFEDPGDSNHQSQTNDQTDKRRQHDEDERGHPFFTQAGNGADNGPVKFGFAYQNVPA